MPVEVKWYEAEEKNIIYVFEGRWTWDECHAAIDAVGVMLDESGYPVYLIIDFRRTHFIPPINFDALSRIAKARGTYHENTRGLIVIGLKQSIAMAYNVFRRIFPKAAARYQIVKEEAELEALLTAFV